MAEQAAHAREAGQVVRLHMAFHGAPVPVLEGTHAAEEDTTYSTRGFSLFQGTDILQKSTIFKASVKARSSQWTKYSTTRTYCRIRIPCLASLRDPNPEQSLSYINDNFKNSLQFHKEFLR